MVAKLTALAACTAVLVASSGPAFAEPGPPHQWKTLELPGKDPNIYTVRPGGVIEIESRAAVSILYTELDTEHRQGRHLTWRWLVERSVPATDLAKRGADDRDLAVHVWFSNGAETAGWSNRFYTWALGAIGFPPIGKTLTYVWGAVTPSAVTASPIRIWKRRAPSSSCGRRGRRRTGGSRNPSISSPTTGAPSVNQRRRSSSLPSLPIPTIRSRSASGASPISGLRP